MDYLSFKNPSDTVSSSYPLSEIQPIPGDELFQLASTLTPNIAYYLPRNVDIQQVAKLAPVLNTSGVAEGTDVSREWVEVQENWVGDKLKAVTAYFGGLVAE
jgi:trimethylguanosine synthase